jgi:endonuclease/exonuclease/phosphatase family metal-dependent hydrolase
MHRAGTWLLQIVGGCGLLGLVAVFACGYAAAYVPPDASPWAWVLGPFAVLLPAVSFVLVLGAVPALVLGVRQQRWMCVAGAAALLLPVALRFGPALAFPGDSTPTAAEELRVMTFNASTAVDAGPEAATVLEAVRAADPDVLALQEAHVRTHPRRGPRYAPSLQAMLSAGYRLPDVPTTRRVLQSVLSRRVAFDAALHNVIPRSDSIPPFRGQATASRVRFRWKGTSVTLYNVHLHTVSARKPWRETPLRLGTLATWLTLDFWRPYVRSYRDGAHERAQQARTLADLLRQETGPVLVMGDFNSTRHHWVYRHIASGLREAYVHRGPLRGATYPASRPLVRIDHVLASPHWTVLDMQVPPCKTASDHRPVVARLRLDALAP